MTATADRRAWRKLRTSTSWLSRAWELGQSLRPQVRSADRLFVVGTPTFDPWHVTAHLDDEARLTGLTELRPTLLRWSPPAGAPAHLAHSFAELRDAGSSPTILVVAPDALHERELEGLADARRRGASLFAVSAVEGDLADLAHESLTLNAESVTTIGAPFEVATHLLTVSAGTIARPRAILRRTR